MRIAVALALLALVAACGSTAPGANRPLAACKAAMAADYRQAQSSGQAATEPAACKGLSQAQLTSIAGQVIGSSLPTPSPSPSAMFTDPNGTVCPSPKPGDPMFGSGVCPAG